MGQFEMNEKKKSIKKKQGTKEEDQVCVELLENYELTEEQLSTMPSGQDASHCKESSA